MNTTLLWLEYYFLNDFINASITESFRRLFPSIVFKSLSRYKIDFKKPEEQVRKKILSNVFKNFSSKTIDALTEQFSLTGGQIANIKKKLLVKSILDANLDQELYLSTLCNEEFILSKSGRSTIGFIH